MKLTRLSDKPIMKPNIFNIWESKYVFNPGVVYDGELFHMLYRAQGADMVSRFGYAVSKDGINFNRMNEPVFQPEDSSEAYGVEDARITFIDGEYHVLYTAYSYEHISLAMATTKNFITWERKGIILNGIHDKDGGIFPEKIDGKYLMLHSIEPNIYISYSDDKITWENASKIAEPREKKWDNKVVGIGGVPIKTEYGWLLLYHGVEEGVRSIYRLGFMLLDLNDPRKVLKRSEECVFEPQMNWEIVGGIPNVVFSNALVECNDEYYIYYGGADSNIGVCSISKREVEKWISQK